MNLRVTLAASLAFASCVAQIEDPPPVAHDAVRPHVAEPIGAPIRLDAVPVEKPVIATKQRVVPLAGHVEVSWQDEALGTRFTVTARSCAGFAGPWTSTVTATGEYTGSAKPKWSDEGVEIALPIHSETMDGTVKGTLAAIPSSAGDTHQLHLTGTLQVETTGGTITLPKIDQFLDVKPVGTPCPAGGAK